MIIIDTNPDQYSLQPHNAIHVNEWHGDLDDTRLLELVRSSAPPAPRPCPLADLRRQVPFLEAVFKEDIPDVRDVLSVWPADSVPEKFRELKRQVAERKKRGERSPPPSSARAAEAFLRSSWRTGSAKRGSETRRVEGR